MPSALARNPYIDFVLSDERLQRAKVAYSRAFCFSLMLERMEQDIAQSGKAAALMAELGDRIDHQAQRLIVHEQLMHRRSARRRALRIHSSLQASRMRECVEFLRSAHRFAADRCFRSLYDQPIAGQLPGASGRGLCLIATEVIKAWADALTKIDSVNGQKSVCPQPETGRASARKRLKPHVWTFLSVQLD